MNVPVEPLLRAAERDPLAKASPESLFVLLSLLSAVEVEVDVDVDVDVDVLVLVFVLLLSFVFVLTLLFVFVVTLLSVCVRLLWSLEMLLLLVPPLSVVWLLVACANAALLNPNAIAMADAIRVFFMEPPEVCEVK